jgi:hypothetical protein
VSHAGGVQQQGHQTEEQSEKAIMVVYLDRSMECCSEQLLVVGISHKMGGRAYDKGHGLSLWIRWKVYPVEVQLLRRSHPYRSA